MSKIHLLFAALLLTPLLTAACAHTASRNIELSPEQLAEAQAAFDKVYRVLQHPRCRNCHPEGDRPLQYDGGKAHGMNVVRGGDDWGVVGMRCAGCHGTSNGPLPNMPPGIAGEWRLAPREMVFEGASQAQLASMLLDPKRSHMSPEEILEHVSHDALVLWGWDPGPGRDPVPVPHSDFVSAFRTWIDAGCPMPAEGTR